MVVNIAFTSPVNHADLKPLSAADVWAGIVLTVRRPEDFVDYISRTEILEDTGASLKRILHFVEGGVHNAPGGKLDQTVSIFPDFKVEFFAAATGKATMSVSSGAADEDDSQVFLTQAFEVAYPEGVEPGSQKAVAQYDHLAMVARRNVVSNIKSFRELKEKGRI